MIVAMSQPTASRELRGTAVLADPLVAELLAARTIGVLATIEPDGWVHAVPMWWAAGEGEVVLATGSAAARCRTSSGMRARRSYSTTPGPEPRSAGPRYAAACRWYAARSPSR